MFEFLPASVRERSSADRLGVAVESQGRLLISWEVGQVRSMKVGDSLGREVDGFGVEVTGLWRDDQGRGEMYKEQWVDFWWKTDNRWVWTGRD